MKTIGLTGPSGSGKGALESILLRHGVPFLDTDAVYHEMVSRPSDCLRELKSTFGDFILSADGSLDRKRLAAYVFDSEGDRASRLEALNRVTHKHVLDVVRLWLRQKESEGYKAAIVDAPLLYESGFDEECDLVIAVLAHKEVRLARIMLRDGISEKEARARIDAQPSDDFYKERADFVINNDTDITGLGVQAKSILTRLGL